MRKQITLTAAAFLVLAFAAIHFTNTRAFASDTTAPSSSTHPDSADISKIHYVVEYTKPTIYMPIGDVEVTFFSEQPQSILVAVLQRELEKQVRKEQPTSDIMTTAWLHKDNTDPNADHTTGDSDGFPYFLQAVGEIMPLTDAKKTGQLQH
jgi:hypothetical protein